jgi:hypothetical protein
MAREVVLIAFDLRIAVALDRRVWSRVDLRAGLRRICELGLASICELALARRVRSRLCAIDQACLRGRNRWLRANRGLASFKRQPSIYLILAVQAKILNRNQERI